MEERKDIKKEKDVKHVEWGTEDKRLVGIFSKSTKEKEHSEQKRD